MIAYRNAAVAAAVSILVSHTALADNGSGSGNTDSSSDLQQVVVSATRTAQPIAKTGDSISVISGADLDTRQTLIISDALATVPGVAVARNGGVGQTTSVYIRGANANQSLVLIDGIRISDPSSPDGSAVLSDLLVNNIDRIEVLRGPQSTLYGSDAIGGVVNILTQRGAGAPLAGRLSAEAGSYDSYRLNAAFNGTDGALDYGAAVNYFDTRGISAADVANGNTEPDGYRNLGLTANTRAHLSDSISLDLRGFYLRSRTDIDGYPPPDYSFQDTPEFGENRLRAGYAALNGSWLNGTVSQRLAMVGSDSDRRFFGVFNPSATAPTGYSFSPDENFYAEGGATRFEYQGIFELGSANEFTYGAETELTTLTTNSLDTFVTPNVFDDPTNGRDRLTGYYGQWQSTIAQQLTLTAAARYDHDDQFGGHGSYKLAAAWQLNNGATILRANTGDGFKAPSLYQQFSVYSNPLEGLRPETSNGWELGVDQSLMQNWRASLTYFARGDRNLIDFFSCPFGGVPTGGCVQRAAVGGYYFNIDRAYARGIEAEVVGHPQTGVTLWVNYTNLKADDDLTGLALARRPHISANAGASFAVQANTSLGASLNYVGSRFDDAGNSVPLESSHDLIVFANYALTSSLQFTARVENLTDDRVEPTAGYGSLGRAFYAGLRATL